MLTFEPTNATLAIIKAKNAIKPSSELYGKQIGHLLSLMLNDYEVRDRFV